MVVNKCAHLSRYGHLPGCNQICLNDKFNYLIMESMMKPYYSICPNRLSVIMKKYKTLILHILFYFHSVHFTFAAMCS